MDKNNDIFINYYVDWKPTHWLKDLFDQNGFEFDESILEDKPVTPERAPSLNDNQRGI
jgi:hypothetical protein